MTAPTDHDRPEKRNGAGARIGKVLAEAMAERAAAVEAAPSAEVRAALDERIARRARVRRTRRAVLATGSAVVALILVAGAVLLGDGGGSDLATDDGGGRDGDREPVATTAAPPELVLGDSGDDPEDFGLPRVGFDPDLDLQLQAVGGSVVTTATAGPSDYGFEQVQVFRREGEGVPVIVVPRREPGTSGSPLRNAVPSTTIVVNGTDALLQGTPPGWTHLTWMLPDGAQADLYAYGLSTETLVDVAQGMRTAPGGGYVAGQLPPGFTEERLPAPPADDVVAQYRLEFRRGGIHLQLEVTSATREEQAEALLTALTTFGDGENRDILGSPGILLGVDSFWSAASDPRPGVTASITVSGATRAEVEEILAGLRELSAAEWSAALATGAGS